MNNLINVSESNIGGNRVQTVNGRDLWRFLESRQDFSTWLNGRIRKFGFVENKDFLLHNFMEQVHGGHNRKDYHISLDMAKELAMVENNEKGRQARQYFIECERKLKEQNHQSIDFSREGLSRLLITAGQALEKKDLIIQEMKPKADYCDRLAKIDDWVSMGVVAKEVFGKDDKTGKNKIFKMLRDRGILYYENGINIPRQPYVDQGYFRVKTTVYQDRYSGEDRIRRKTVISPKGTQFIQRLCNREDETEGDRLGHLGFYG